MKKIFQFSFLISLSTSIYGELLTSQEIIQNRYSQNVQSYPKQENNSYTNKTEIISEKDLINNYELTEYILKLAISQKHKELIEDILLIYNKFPQKKTILVLFTQGVSAKLQQHYDVAISYFRQILAINPNLNPVRIELATTLFADQQLTAAKEQFEKAKAEPNLPANIAYLLEQYLNAIEQHSDWQNNLSFNYLRDPNVNNTSHTQEIENTGFIKSKEMLPQSAHGIAYHFNLSKEYNLFSNHYIYFENTLWGKYYWDNKDYNDILNRTYLGYINKSAVQNWKILPFYGRRWVGKHRYQWEQGLRGELSRWLSPNWQISTALEYSKQRYFSQLGSNGFNQLASITALWLRNARQYFYTGIDFNREKTRVRQYSSDIKTLRLGWGQEWRKGISSRLSFSFAKRQYKAEAKLGGILPLGKIRSDKIYQAQLMLWKRDWHLWGITPKLQLSWKKQVSNIPSMYSYQSKNINLLFDKSF
ncbi:porin family protein [Avibacterium sp. 20-129]|uniref:porin family protein n=1 Tax=Avibacterium sp. 20-129 TaxID=2911525 RepID=UPI002244FD9A|nr:porin family protein [Avibacterium sp. 20-129]MCW9697943.1 surface lipoprotein assembly modifier [Avibacterium sp. 20-129]